MTYNVLNPSNEHVADVGQLAIRPKDLIGKTVGFISNGKEGTKGFFAHLERLLVSQHGVQRIVHEVKSNYSAPASAGIISAATAWDFAITGLGD